MGGMHLTSVASSLSSASVMFVSAIPRPDSSIAGLQCQTPPGWQQRPWPAGRTTVRQRFVQKCAAHSSSHRLRHAAHNLRAARPCGPAPCRAMTDKDVDLFDWSDQNNPLNVLPAFYDADVHRIGETYVLFPIARYVCEGTGSVRGRPALIKSASLDMGTDAADHVLNEVRVYQRLAHLEGQCIPVLVGAGKLGGAEQHGTEEHGVFLAIGGCQRLWKAQPPEDPALQRYTDVSRIPRDVKWAALNGLRELHDAGVLHGCANSRSLFVQPNHADGALPRLLWGDFGASSIVPGMNRHWPAAQDEAFLAALEFGLPEWNHANLLTPPNASAATDSASIGRPAVASLLAHELPIPELLPAFDEAVVQFTGKAIRLRDDDGGGWELASGTICGQPARIKVARLNERPNAARELVAEVKAYRKLAHLQGTCIPAVIASGCLHEGSTGFIAMADAGISLYDLAQRGDVLLPDSAISCEEEAEALEALARIHDGGVVHGDPRAHNLMIQRIKDGFEADRVMWVDFGNSQIVPGMSRASLAAKYDEYSASDHLEYAAVVHQQHSSRRMSTQTQQ